MTSKNYANQIRIIGGVLRGRRLPVANIPGLRPTGNRMRETLFNWLQPNIVGAKCLDLFAGSGALGFEAISRGASKVVMLDNALAATLQLQRNQQLLNLPQVAILQTDTIAWLQHVENNVDGFDVIFIDPPFGSEIDLKVCNLLLDGGWIKSNTFVYLERAYKTSMTSCLPKQLVVLKERHMGQVWCGLLKQYV